MITKLEWDKEIKTRSNEWMKRFPNWPDCGSIGDVEVVMVRLSKKIDEIIDVLNVITITPRQQEKELLK